MNNTIKHKADCKMVFGRKDPTCPRCQELLQGAAPRQGWGYQARLDADRRSRAISNHYSNNHEENCDYARRKVPCVAFDW